MNRTKNLNKYILTFIFIQFAGAVFFQFISLYIGRFFYEILRIMYVLLTLYLLNRWKIGINKNENLISKYKMQIKNKELIICFLISILGWSLTNQFISDQALVKSLPEVFFYLYDNFLMAAVYEEIIFRGCFFDEFKKRYSVLICMLLTGILFSCLHIPQQILHKGGLQLQWELLGILKGMFLCCVVLVSKNIFITACFHFNTAYLGDVLGLLVLLPYFLWKSNKYIFSKNKIN